MNARRTTAIGFVVTTLLFYASIYGQDLKGKGAPISLTIQSPSKEIKSGSNLVLQVTVSNISERKIGVQVMDVSPFVADVHGPNGPAVPPNDKGQKLNEKQRSRLDPNLVGSRVGRSLESGESFTETFEVSDYYEMTQPGKYTIQLERIWHGTVVPSNTITVQVVP